MKKGIAFLSAAVVMAVAFIACSHRGEEETEPILKLNETELTVDSEGGTLSVGVTSNMPWNVVSDADWCVLENYSGSGNGSVTVKVSPNASSSERKAKLTVSGGSLKAEAEVRQLGSEPGNNEELPNESGNGNESDTEIKPLDKSSGKLPGRFSVSPTKQVIFSKGNLQYKACFDTWQFAENQYDVIGKANKNISATYDGWIDLFGWGTSGYNGKFPYMVSGTGSDFGDGDQVIDGTNYDWGVFNGINGGGYMPGLWRTLSQDEWAYLYEGRDNAENLRGMATVNGVTGYIFLPDGWKLPSGLAFTADLDVFNENSYDVSQWHKMEAAGALFLPSAGMRDGTTVHYVGISGRYHSTTHFGLSQSYYFYFTSSSYKNVTPMGADLRCSGNSVRLVQD